MMLRPTLVLCVCLCASLAICAGDDAYAGEDLRLPAARPAPVSDGRLDEQAWQIAVRLPVESVEVPVPPPGEGSASVTPVVRLLTAAGRLWVSAEVAEDPGTAIGLHLFVAADDAQSAADAVSIGFRPVDLRAPRYAVRGPRGAGRTTYRVDGAADWEQVGRWSAEMSVPLADLVGGQTDAPLRVALVVFTRTPNLVAASPPGACWTEPGRWLRVLPPEGGWNVAAAEIDVDRIAAEDQTDRARRMLWLEYKRNSSAHFPPNLPESELRALVDDTLLKPLESMMLHAPDLCVPVQVLRGDTFHRLGLSKEADEAFREAVRVAPGWREAQYGLHLQVGALRHASGTIGEPSDYDATFRRLDALAKQYAEEPWAREGLALARGLLHYKRGDFAAATKLLDAFEKRYPHESFIGAHAVFARRAAQAWTEETRQRARDEQRKLPRAVLATPAGRIVIELFEDDVPNTVSNFVWLGRHGFFDDLPFHRVLPYFVLQGGDCHARDDSEGQRGTGTPGYAIRTEVGRRFPFRGAVAMANTGRDSEGSQFFILTGTAAHLDKEQAVFGRVVEGQGVAERLRAGDRIQRVTFERLDPERAYRPTTVAGSPAPEPDCR